MGRHLISPFGLLAALPTLLSVARADCECGYAVNIGDERHVFTDMIENDFVHLDIMASDSEYGEYGWAAQVHDRTGAEARGPYGESFRREQVVSNDIEDSGVYEGSGRAGPDAGLRLVVGSSIDNNMVPNAEVATTGMDYFYGTFRAGLKVTGVAGTCSAFFWYFNDTQEIDIEFLSAEFDPDQGKYPVNLVLQSPESSDAGHDASNTKDYKKVDLPFDPTSDFHEYRFDYLADRVIFYADNIELVQMEGSSVPTEPGHIILSHWSNGNHGWSEGPPSEDAITTVSYVKSYFNSSLDSRHSDFTTRCTDPAAAAAVCDIPDNDPRFFFSRQENSAPNQTTYSDDNAGEKISGSWSLLLAVALVSSMWTIGL